MMLQHVAASACSTYPATVVAVVLNSDSLEFTFNELFIQHPDIVPLCALLPVTMLGQMAWMTCVSLFCVYPHKTPGPNQEE